MPFGDDGIVLRMDRAVARLSRALAEQESIAIYGDFDVDGVSATAILTDGQRIAREIEFDSDLWLVEVEDRQGRDFLDLI